MDEELKKQVDVVVGLSRLAGGMLIIIGSILVFFFIQAAQDPNAAIEINGVPTKDFTAKVGAVIFTALFPLFGIFLSFAPSNLLEKWTTKIILLISNKA
ncbi:hypothetical protein [Pseudoalteromonas shioyasakiensis]|uniref:hypothetical protein n=1 Tax=Pseudoalteromonas shioyasakiensis TaxID=1190813 RepID=UPI002551E197|nr:hypothetical protein [Pseudoalteromonas shioyasakiensis]MDK9682848.1 hypothetical protein [Pseudoalteromonas shioyasakiensis]